MVKEEIKKKIEEVVRKAEAKTSGEIVPVILRASDNYPGATWRFAITFALLFLSIFYLAYPYLDFLIYLVAEILLIVIGLVLGQISSVKRLFLSKIEIEEEVYQRALSLFHERNLHSTVNRTGILILVSLLERRAQILADTGINSVVPHDTWNKVVEQLVLDIQSHKLEEGFCKAVETCGRILAEHFPIKANDTDELEDKLISG